MHTYKTHLIGIALGLLIPLQGLAYFTPEDVLLSKEYFLPPTSRETGDRIQRQVDSSANRRDHEQDLIFSEQRVAELRDLDDDDLLGDILDDGDTLHAAAPSSGLDDADLDLLKTIRLLEQREGRLLDRVQTNQQYVQYYDGRPDFLHGGAPPLAPTGAGGVLSAIVMIGAVIWTLQRVQKAGRAVRSA